MSDLLLEAMSAKQSGDIALAKQLLSQALIQEPGNEAAWMLMSDVVEDVRLRRNCLERVLAINPENTAAGIALTKLNTSPLSPIIRGERDKPLNPPKLEKIPPFTPPFTWKDKQEQFLALGELTYPNLTGEQTEEPAETTPTFDWANDSDEPDKAIQKIFNAISNPELASQPLTDTDLGWLDEDTTGEFTETPPEAKEKYEDRYPNEWVGSPVEPLPEQQPGRKEDFTVSSEPQLGLDAFTFPEEPMESLTSDHRLWHNPKAKLDRLVILSNKSLVYANPKESDIPHILGLFAENKMMRDLLGENAGMIKLESILRLSVNPNKADLSVDYLNQDEKTSTLQLTFSSPQVRDEVLEALRFRIGADFYEATQSFSLQDKIVPPFVVLLLLAFLGWGMVAGIPMLSELPGSQLGALQGIISSMQNFVTSAGIINLLLIVGFFGLLTVLWLVSNLKKPTKLIVVERHRRK